MVDNYLFIRYIKRWVRPTKAWCRGWRSPWLRPMRVREPALRRARDLLRCLRTMIFRWETSTGTNIRMITFSEPMQFGSDQSCLIYSTFTTSLSLFMIRSIISIWLPTSVRTQCQQTSPSISKIGDHSLAIAISMDASGNSRSDQCFSNPRPSPSSCLIKKVIHGTYASCLSRNSWCVTRRVQLKLTRHICTTVVSMTIHVTISLSILWITVVWIYSSLCLRLTKCVLWAVPWNPSAILVFKLSPITMDPRRIRKFFTIDVQRTQIIYLIYLNH